MSVTVSVPGKLMLLGEHAVVYGHPCLVATVDRSVTVIVSSSDKEDSFETPGVTDHRFLVSAVSHFRSLYSCDPLHIQVSSQLGTYGLGSSAAVTVAVIAAMAIHAGVTLSRKELFDLAYAAVLQVQTVASGFDVAISIWGGTVAFDGKTKNVTSLGMEPLPVVVAYSGKKVSTVSLVEQVADRYQQDPVGIENLFSQMDEVTARGHHAIQDKQWLILGSLMQKQQAFLVQLGVSTEKLDSLVAAAIEEGAYGAKLSGAGGGDCMIAVVSEDKRKPVEQAIQQAGGEIVRMSVGTRKGIL